jgi:hypothetical protein
MQPACLFILVLVAVVAAAVVVAVVAAVAAVVVVVEVVVEVAVVARQQSAISISIHQWAAVSISSQH